MTRDGFIGTVLVLGVFATPGAALQLLNWMLA